LLLFCAYRQAALYVIRVPFIVVSHLKILISVSTAIIIVADVKYARVSTSIPTVNILCAHTTNPSNPVANIAKIIPIILLIHFCKCLSNFVK
jgi:hypothetical protein